MLIRRAEVGAHLLDVRCRDGLIVEMAPLLTRSMDEAVVDARGGVLLPGLHDHHMHLFALAAASLSVRCGPPAVVDRPTLQAALLTAPGVGWIRGVGYHESVAGELDRRALDALCAHRPVRIQHDSGRVWYLNSLAVDALGLPADAEGELFRDDVRLRALPTLSDIDAQVTATAARLAAGGVTGITDASPSNDEGVAARLAALRLPLRVHLLGGEALATGALKILLDDYALPGIDVLRARIAAAHARSRPVAVHCVTRTELVFAVSVLCEAGVLAGDRIEHASVTDDASLELIRRAGLTVITQPNLVAERGDRYLADVDVAEVPLLYRCGSFIAAGVPLAAGTDAPYGNADPWLAMRAAVSRRTAQGRLLGAAEAVAPEQALALFTGSPDNPGGRARRVEVGACADLCLLRVPWRDARERLLAADVAATFLAGRCTYEAPSPGGR